MKVLAAYLLLKLDFDLDLDEDLRDSEFVSFSVQTKNALNVKIKKVNY